MPSHLTISDVAAQTGLSVHTLRYYERAGLIETIGRAPGGRRRYAKADLDWISFLLRLRETRMPIGQMQTFARLRSQGDAIASQRRELLEKHLADVLAAITAMQHAATVLQDKIMYYEGLQANAVPAPPPPQKRTSR